MNTQLSYEEREAAVNKEKAALYEEAVETIQQEGYTASFRETYSGRGMYGDQVPAIVTEASGAIVAWAVMVCLYHNLEDNGATDAMYDSKRLLPLREDSMGLSRIYY